MLKLMRDSLKHLKWVLIFVVAVFVLFAFAEWGGGGMLGGMGAASAGFAARVNGDPITVPDYQRSLGRTIQQYEQIYGQRLTPEMQAQLDLPRQVLDSLVEQQLMIQEARRLGLEPGAEELRQRILEIPVLNPNGKFVGEELYGRYVMAQLGYPSTAAFERDMGRDLMLAKLNSALMSSIAIPGDRVEREYRRRNESTRVRFIMAPAASYATDIKVSAEEIDAFYRANASRYSHPEQRRIEYLLADESRIGAQINVTDAELRQYYDANRQSYSTDDQVSVSHILLEVPAGATPAEAAAVEQRARDLVTQLRAGADFGALAREHSADPGSAANDGSLGFFGRGQMVGEFEEASFSQPIGQVGDPVRTQFGFHIIRVDDKREGGVQPFDQVSAAIRQQLLTERAETQARDRLAQIRARLESQGAVTGEALRAAADNFVTHNVAPFFARGAAIEGLGPAPQLGTWAFGAENGALSPIIDTQQGPVVAWLRESRPAGVAPLTEIRARVENDARMDKAARQAAQAIERAQAAGSGFDAVASQLQLTPQDASLRIDSRLPGIGGDHSEIVKSAFEAEAGQLRGPFITPDGAVLIEVLEQQRVSPEQFAEQRATLEESMRQTESVRLRTTLLEKLRRAADVEINEDLVAPAVPQF